MPGYSWAACLVLCSLLSFTMIKHAVFDCLMVKGIQQRSLSSSLLPASEQRCVSLFAQPPLGQSTAVSEGDHSHCKIDPLLFFSCPHSRKISSSDSWGLFPLWNFLFKCLMKLIWKSFCPQKQQRQISSLERDDSDCFPTISLVLVCVQHWIDSTVHPHPPSQSSAWDCVGFAQRWILCNSRSAQSSQPCLEGQSISTCSHSRSLCSQSCCCLMGTPKLHLRMLISVGNEEADVHS